MSHITITYEETETKGRCVARITGVDDTAELTVTKTSPAVWIADHIGVPDSLRVTGIGKVLVQHMVAEVQAAGHKILPLCPFVKSHAARHPEWRDLFS